MANQGNSSASSHANPAVPFDFINDPNWSSTDLGEYSNNDSVPDLNNPMFATPNDGYNVEAGNFFDLNNLTPTSQSKPDAQQLQQYAHPQEGFMPMQPTSALSFPPALPPAGARYHFSVGWYLPFVEGIDGSRLEWDETINLWFTRVAGPAPPRGPSQAPSVSSMDQDMSMPYPAPTLNTNNPYPALAQVQIPVLPLNQQLPSPRPVQTTVYKGPRAGKYDPNAYINEVESRRAEGDASGQRPVSRPTYHYGGPLRTPTGRVSKKKVPFRGERKARVTAPGNVLGLLNQAIVQKCVCKETEAAHRAHVPRPRNAFIFYRSHLASNFRPGKGEKKVKDNAQISRDAGVSWKAMTQSQRAPFQSQAKEDAARVRAEHPEYRYGPGNKIAAKFGFHTCRCGARGLNMQVLHDLGSPRRIVKALACIGEPVGGQARRPSVSRTPVAQMYPRQQPQDEDDEEEDENEDEDANGDEEDDYGASRRHNGSRRRSSQSAMKIDDRPAPTRRLTRATKKQVQFAEADEDDESLFVQQPLDDDEDDGGRTPTQADPTPNRRHRSASIATHDANNSMNTLQRLRDPGFVVHAARRKSVSHSPPRRRSKSRSPEMQDAGYTMSTEMELELFDAFVDEMEVDENGNINFADLRRRSITPPKPVVGRLALPPRPATRSQSRGQSRSGRSSRR